MGGAAGGIGYRMRARGTARTLRRVSFPWIIDWIIPPMPTAPAATRSPPGWTLTDLEARAGGGRIELAAPAAGLAVGDGDRLLGLDLRTGRGDPRLIDHWVRANDLVCVYEPADPRRLRATAMWRSLAGERPAWELVVSAQTSLVESDAAVAVTCELAAGEVLWGRAADGRIAWSSLGDATCPPEATCLLVRRTSDAIVMAVHPADPRRMLVRSAGGRVGIACWLFSTAIEKGVLLRSRVLAALGPGGDPAWAEPLLAGFAASPPPLTT